MKHFIVFFCVAFLAAGCATTRTMLEEPSSETVLISHRTGVAAVARGDGVFRSATRGNVVRQGDIARTGADGRLDFNLRDYGGVLTLHEHSTVRFEQIGRASDPEVILVLDLSRGRVTGDTLELPRGTKIVVKTPGGVHEIR